MTDAKLMNPFKEYPNLFANGKFEIKMPHEGAVPFLGLYIDKGNMMLRGGYPQGGVFTNSLNNCTLIARPISDMTDKECTESVLFECLRDKADPKYIRKELVEMNYLKRTMRLSLYLISIGVYPFDQSHFEDGTVIDVNTL